jgi:endonuclease YncB( thermonuclease family)
MNKLIAALLLGISTTAAAQSPTPLSLPVNDVYDGDTFRTELPLPPPLNRVYIRIRGIDTPEKGSRAKCEKEKQLANAAAAHLKSLVKVGTTITIEDYDWDKFGSRIDARVISNGVDVGKEMIAKGFAAPYSGEGPKPDWCK